ncbi:hypothetical protein LguiB_008235 [Lonicera macranthoides]
MDFVGQISGKIIAPKSPEEGWKRRKQQGRWLIIRDVKGLNISGSGLLDGRGNGCIGSLGRSGNQVLVENITVDGVHFFNTTNGLRIKTWQGSGVHISEVSYARTLGTSLGDYAINLNCSEVVPCTNILLERVELESSTPGVQVNSSCNNAYGNAAGIVQPKSSVLGSTTNPTSYTPFNVLDYGATGDGKTDDSQAFRKTWKAACDQAESDAPPSLVIPTKIVFFLNPVKFTGPCKSSKISVLLSGKIVAPKEKSAWEGVTVNSWLSFANVNGLTINGKGRIDGRGFVWWSQPCLSGNHLKQAPTLTESTFLAAPTYKSETLALKQTSAIKVSDVTYRGILGTSKTDQVINLSCSETVACTNIVIDHVYIKTTDPARKAQAYCLNAHGSWGHARPAQINGLVLSGHGQGQIDGRGSIWWDRYSNFEFSKVARNNQVKVNTLTQKPLMKEKFRNLTKFKVRVVLLKIESEGGTKENIEDVLQASKSTGEGNESASHPSPFDVPRQDKGKEGLEDLEQSEHGKEFESSEEDDSEFEESPTNSNRIPTPVDEGTVNKEKSTNEKEVHSTQNAIKKVHIMSERWLM